MMKWVLAWVFVASVAAQGCGCDNGVPDCPLGSATQSCSSCNANYTLMKDLNSSAFVCLAFCDAPDVCELTGAANGGLYTHTDNLTYGKDCFSIFPDGRCLECVPVSTNVRCISRNCHAQPYCPQGFGFTNLFQDPPCSKQATDWPFPETGNFTHAACTRTCILYAFSSSNASSRVCNHCAPGYFGDTCEVCPGTVSPGPPCSGKGTCNERSGECTCEEGYYGLGCQYQKKHCQGRGSPLQNSTVPFTCVCDPGWDPATNCSTCLSAGWVDLGGSCSPCNVSTCNSHGRCGNATLLNVCECDVGYTGESCEECDAFHYRPAGTNGSCISCMAADKCSGHGHCNGTDGSCICDAGFTGPNCADCPTGYFGLSCQIPCPGLVNGSISCNGHGTCDVGLLGTGVCTCAIGYAGSGCQFSAATVCNGHGSVWATPSDTTVGCQCDTGFAPPNCHSCLPDYYGSNCIRCGEDTCGGVGVFAGTGAKGRCQLDGSCLCDAAYTGTNCEQCAAGRYDFPRCVVCNASTCSNHGTCAADGSCTCSAGWQGLFCSDCATGYFGPSCTACQCGGNGRCLGGVAGNGTCVCDSPFKGSQCQDPVIVMAMPLTAPTSGGAIRLIGHYLTGTPTVSVEGRTNNRSCTGVSTLASPACANCTEINCNLGPTDPNINGQARIIATFPTASTSLLYNFQPPLITSITYAGSANTTGVTVTINGLNFGEYASVTFGANAAVPLVCSQVQIVFAAPAGQGSVPVFVSVAGRNSPLYTFTYAAPYVSSATSASTSTAGGGLLTVTGANFGTPSGTVIVMVGSQSCSVTGFNQGQILCSLPASHGVQPVTVTVDGIVGSTATTFAYGAPTITGVSGCVDAGPTTGGCSQSASTTITIDGTNFGTSPAASGGSGPLLVTVHGVPCGSVAIASRVTCVLPAGGFGTNVPVVVSRSQLAGPAQVATANSLSFQGPVITPSTLTASGATVNTTSYSVNLPSTTGGQNVLIVGSGFGVVPASVTVRFFAPSDPNKASLGASPYTNCVVNTVSDTSIACTLGAGVGRNLVFQVRVAGLYSDYSKDVLNHPIHSASTVNLLSSVNATANNFVVTIAGANFGGAAFSNQIAVTYGPSSDKSLYQCVVLPATTDNSIQCRYGGGALSGMLLRITIGAFDSATSIEPALTINGAVSPTITSIVLPSACTGNLCPTDAHAQGLLLTVNVANLVGVPVVRLGPVVCPEITVVSATQITCRIPDFSGKAYTVVVSQDVLSSAQSFTVSYQNPVISTITGSCIDGNGTFACQGGETITVTGSNFGPATGLAFLVQGVPCGNLVKLTEGSLTCTLPTLWARTPSALVLVQQSGDISNVVSMPLYSGCNPGTFYNFALDVCSSCPARTFQGAYGKSSCFPCQPGTYSPIGSSSCMACPPGQFSPLGAAGCQNATLGTYCATSGMPSCPACPAGSYSNVPGASACTLCMAIKGEYSTGMGRTGCSVCALGTFAAQDGQSFCSTCQPGKYTFNNADQGNYGGSPVTTCNPCTVGTFYNPALLPAFPCQNCSVGRYTSVAGALECVQCQPGSYGVALGASACVACAPGKALNALGAISCQDCQPGKYSNFLGAVTCLDCPVNTWSTLTANAAGCLNCPAGQETTDTGRTACRLCPAGKAVPGGGKRCAFCPSGKFSNSSGLAQCLSAPLDYSTADAVGASSATPCPIGTEARKPGSISCQDCPVGSFNNRSGSGQGCGPCPPGTFSALPRASVCQVCTPGKYQRLWGQESCTACEPGSYNTVSGSLGCTDCPIGQVQPSSGTTTCTTCPPNQRTVTLGSTTCDFCPSGQQFDNTSSFLCSNCPLGRSRYGAPVEQFDDGMCKSCPPGTYADTTGLFVCRDCPYNFYCRKTNSTDLVNPVRCPAGSIANQTKLDACYECPPGKYALFGALTCESCLPHTYQDQAGKSSCYPCTVTGTGNAFFGAMDPDSEDRTSCRVTKNGYRLVGRYWQLCPPGSDSSRDAAHTSCMECLPGTYSNGTSPNGCLPCEAGKSQRVRGETSCEDCELGRYAPASLRGVGPITCYACEAGSYQDSPGQTECRLCLPGTYSPPSGFGGVGVGPSIVECLVCSVGRFSGSGKTACDDCAIGTYQDRVSKSSCTSCEAGKYSGSVRASTCRSCQAGSISAEGADECTKCLAGQYANNATICLPCQPGYDLSSSDQNSCVPCVPGKAWTPDNPENSTECTECPRGTFASQYGQSVCAACPAGQAQNSSGSIACEECTLGSYSPMGGTACAPCEPGRYGSTSPPFSSCRECEAGKAANGTGTSGNCSSCDSGKWTSLTGQAECTECAAGTFSGVKSGATEPCTLCPEGKFASTAQSACTECATNRIAFFPGQAKCLDCTFGVPANEANTVCLCPPGYFVDPSEPLGPNASVTCHPCPIGSDCSQEGRINCRDNSRVCQDQGVQTLSGFWRGSGMSFYRCLLPEHCCAGNATSNCCNQNRGGFLCASCLPGTSANSILGECQPCPDPKEALVVSIVIVVVIFIAAVIMYVILLRADAALIKAMEDEDRKAVEWDLYRNSLHVETKKEYAKSQRNLNLDKKVPKDIDYEAFIAMKGKPDVNYQNYTYKIKIIVGFLQINTSTAFQTKVPWPRVYQNFINAFSIVNLDFAPWQSVACVNPYTFYDKYLALTILPITAFVVICGAFMLFVRVWRQILVTRKEAVGDSAGAQEQREIRERKIIRVVRKFWKLALFTIFLAFPGVCTRTLSFFVCLQNDQTYYLYADVTVQCYDELWYSHLGWAVVCIFLYPVAIPLGFLAVLLHFRKRFDEPGVKLQTGFLYDAYIPGLWWFEMVDVAHKLFMTSIIVFVERFSQMPVALAVLGLYLIVILVVKPYVRSTDDRLHLTCQMELLLLCLVGYRLTNQSIEPLAEFGSAGISDFTGVLLILLTVLVLAIFVIFAVKTVRTLLFSWLAKRRNMLAAATGISALASDDRQSSGSSAMEEDTPELPKNRPTVIDFTGEMPEHVSPLFMTEMSRSKEVTRHRGDTVVLPPPSEPYPDKAPENNEASPKNQGSSPKNQENSPTNQGNSPTNQGSSPTNQGSFPVDFENPSPRGASATLY